MTEADKGFKPIDREEGPTLWARESGEHTVELVSGTDPTAPVDRMFLSTKEVERLKGVFGQL